MYNDLINVLKSENIDDFDKIFAIIELDKLENKTDAEIFLNHLINHSNPIREAVAYKLEDINTNYFTDDFSTSIILKAISDINPNVSRAVCNTLKKNKELAQNIEEKLILKIKELILNITNEEKHNNNKSHAKNKKIFSLYWLQEALSICLSGKYNSQVLEILNFTIDFQDYTIREKTAQILAKMDNPPIKLLNCAKSDQNFYVKNQVYGKITLKN